MLTDPHLEAIMSEAKARADQDACERRVEAVGDPAPPSDPADRRNRFAPSLSKAP